MMNIFRGDWKGISICVSYECWIGHIWIIVTSLTHILGYAWMSNFSWIIYSRPLTPILNALYVRCMVSRSFSYINFWEFYYDEWCLNNSKCTFYLERNRSTLACHSLHNDDITRVQEWKYLNCCMFIVMRSVWVNF